MSPTVLVTGGTGALGSAVTRRLLDDGHRAAVTWVVESEAARVAEELGDSVLAVRADVTDETSIAEAVAQVRAELGPIDALVHLVGAWAGGALTHEHSRDQWERMIELNLTSAFLTARAVLPEMIERNTGRIVFVSTRTARIERAGQVAYAVAKAGVEVLAQTIAEETRSYEVTANAVAPSTLDTPANRRVMPDADTSRWVSVEDVAAAISFLVSEPAGPLRGATLPLYGGV